MNTEFNKKNPNTYNVGNHNNNNGHKFNFKTLINNFYNKILKLI